MKKLLISVAFLFFGFALLAQQNKAEILQNLEKKNSEYQYVSATATLKSSSRLFSVKEDLTSVIMVIPSGSTVKVLDSDSTYLHITFEDNEGYILKRHAVLDAGQPIVSEAVQEPIEVVKVQPENNQVSNRFSYLENKYGTTMAKRLISGKIWKGMNSDMVKDSWGTAEKINRDISGNVIKEEWIFQTTWLYFENNILLEWGPTKK